MEFSNKSGCADNIQGGYTKKSRNLVNLWKRVQVTSVSLLSIKDSMFLEDLSDYGHRRVDRVRNYEYESLRGCRCDASSKIPDDSSVDLEELKIRGRPRSIKS